MEPIESPKLYDVFISYGRKQSKVFAHKIKNALEAQGLVVWLDLADIDYATDWQDRIDKGIAASKTVVFIISPHSIASENCLKEIELSVAYHKRIIPIEHVPVTGETHVIHPAIRKINWIPIKEKADANLPLAQWEQLDDFEQGVEKLQQKASENDAYNETHTQLLLKALAWEKNKRQPSFLLEGSERLGMEEWVRKAHEMDVTNTPSPLHDEFTAASKKHANIQMTDVYFSYHPADAESLDKLNQALWAQNITTSVNKQDIKIASSALELVRDQIERADNFLFLLSELSLQDESCLANLAFAISLNKRIIPIRVQALEESLLPESIQLLRYIDLSFKERNQLRLAQKEKTPYEKNIDSLVNLLEENRAYHYLHKKLLVQANNWERLHESDSFLLRGETLNQAQQWLEEGKSKGAYAPVALQKSLIAASIKKIGILSSEIFIACAPQDLDFATNLNFKLNSFRKTTWFDASYLSGHEPDKDLSKAIARSENFLFIASPSAVEHEASRKALEIAAMNGKRMLPIFRQHLGEESLHPALEGWEQYDFSDTNLESAFSLLLHALNIDKEYVQEHTELQQKAAEWDRKSGKKRLTRLLVDYITVRPNLLLSHDDFQRYSLWADDAKSQQKIPPVTDLQQRFIQETKRYQKVRKGFWVSMLILLLSLPFFYLNYRLEKEREQRFQAQVKASLNYTYVAREILNDDHDPWRALAVAKEGLQLLHALHEDSVYKVLPIFNDIATSIPDTSFFLSGVLMDVAADSSETLFLEVQGNDLVVRNLNGAIKASVEGKAQIDAAYFIPSTQNLLISYQRGGTWIAKSEDWENITVNALDQKINGIRQIIWDYENKHFYICPKNSRIVSKWSFDGDYADVFNNRAFINGMALSPDKKFLATYDDKGETRLWDLTISNKAQSLSQLKSTSGVLDASFFGNAAALFTRHKNGQVATWDVRTKKQLLKPLENIQSAYVLGSEAHPPLLIYQNKEGRAFLQEMGGDFFRELVTYRQIQHGTDGILKASNTSSMALSYALQSYAATWGLNGEVVGEINWEENREKVTDVYFSPDGKWIAAVSGKGSVDIWDNQGKPITSIKAYDQRIAQCAFISDHAIVTISDDGELKVWDLQKTGLPNQAKTYDEVRQWMASIGAADLEMATSEKIRFGFIEAFGQVYQQQDTATLLAYARYYQQEGDKEGGIGNATLQKEHYNKAFKLFRKAKNMGYTQLKIDMGIADLALKMGIDTISVNTLFTPSSLDTNEQLLLAQYLRQRWAAQPDIPKIDAYALAVDLYEGIIRSGNDSVPASRLSFMKRKASNLYNTLAYSYLKTGDLARALQCAQRGKNIDPNYKWINTKLALTHLYNENLTQGFALLDTMKQDQRFGVDNYQEKMKAYIQTLDAIYEKKDMPTLSEIIAESPAYQAELHAFLGND